MPSNSRILIGFLDGGEYFSSLVNCIVIYPPYGRFRQSPLYLQTLDILSRDPSNPAVLEMIQQLGATHVFVGSKLGSDLPVLGPSLNGEKLILSPYFRLLVSSGNSYFFEIETLMNMSGT